MAKPSNAGKTHWHRLLGALLEQLLTPVGISVQCDVKVMSNPPEADILLLRRQTRRWTEEQRQRLADGIRDTTAGHVLLEFKYSESFNEKAMQQTLGYDYFYKRSHRLSDKQVQTFLISSKTPRSSVLEGFAYRRGQHPGIYVSALPVFRHVILIVLNELSDEAHNAWIKCFASQKQQKRKSFEVLKTKGMRFISRSMEYFLSGLWGHWFNHMGEFDMRELTAEQLIEMGKFWGESYLSTLSPKERLMGMDEKEILSEVDHQKILANLDAKERLEGLDIKECLNGFSTEEIKAYLEETKTKA